MLSHNVSRDSALQAIAIEVDKALRIGPVKHIKHVAVPDSEHGIGCLESHLLGVSNGRLISLHDWGYYGKIKATSIIIPEAPRGFTVTLKTDSHQENALRGRKSASIPLGAKTVSI